MSARDRASTAGVPARAADDDARGLPARWRGAAATATVLLLGASGVAHVVDPDIWLSMSLARETVTLGRVPSS